MTHFDNRNGISESCMKRSDVQYSGSCQYSSQNEISNASPLRYDIFMEMSQRKLQRANLFVKGHVRLLDSLPCVSNLRLLP